MAKTLDLPGALPPGLTGALKQAPGPHAVRCYACFALMDTTLWPPQSLLPCYAPVLLIVKIVNCQNMEGPNDMLK